MKLLISVFSAVALLTACQSPEQRMATFTASCQNDYGLSKGTPEFTQCLSLKEQAFMAEAQRASAAISGSMQSYAASQQSYAAANRPLRCTSTPLGTSVNTTCY